MSDRSAVPKLTRTTRYLSSTITGQGFDGFTSLLDSPPPSPPNRRFLPRLSFGATAKQSYDMGHLCHLIEAAEDAVFFCDTSIFHRSTDERLWAALFNRTGKVVIIPHVHHELKVWLDTNPTHVAARTITEQHPAIQFFDFVSADECGRAAYIYYVNLLGMRKRLFDVERWRFEQAYGRLPDDREMEVLRRGVHEAVGPRGYLIAKKGEGNVSSPTYNTDEALVYLAMMTGITTGREVVILTKDEDIQEQFYKLQWLLDTHYRGMLLADLYASDPGGFVHHAPPLRNEHFDEVFVGDHITLIERSEALLSEILPPTCAFTPIYCWVIGNKLTQMTFGAETEMRRLFETKGDTGGLNTNRLNGRNCHIWLAPLDVNLSLRGCAIIAHDQRVSLRPSSVAIPMHDFNQAASCQERFTRILESSHPGVLPVANRRKPVYRRQ